MTHACYGQNKAIENFTKEETQKFISETIRNYSYKTDSIKNKYVIGFKDTIMIITNIQGLKKHFYTTLNVKDIDSILVEEKEHNIWLTIKLNTGKFENTIFNSTPITKSFGRYDFLLNMSFKENELPPKIGQAFVTLKDFYPIKIEKD